MNLDGLLKRTRSAGSELRGGIGEVRTRIAELQEERTRILTAPPTKAVAFDRVDEFIANTVQVASARVPGAAVFARAPGSYAAPRVAPDAWAALFAAHLGPVLGERLKEDIAELYDGDGITEAERERQIARVEGQIFEAELAEESLIRAAEAAGFSIARRADADARAVMADEGSLP